MNYYERYPGDYRRDTARLSLAEHGAYTQLMDEYYASESPLPAGYPDLYRIAGAQGAAEQRAVRSVADQFFPVDADGLRHKNRCDEEIAKAQKRIENARKNGAKHQPNKNPAGNPAGNENGTQRVTQLDTQRVTHSGEALHAPCSKDQKLSSSGKPDDPGPEVENLAAKTRDAIEAFNATLAKPAGLLPQVKPAIGFAKRQTQVRRCLGIARDISREQYGGALAPQFWADYFGACAADPFLSGRQSGGKGHENWLPDFEYLTRPETVLKTYDRNAE